MQHWPIVSLALCIVIACGPGGRANPDAVGGCQNICSALGWQQCLAGGSLSTPVACADDQVCSAELGCVTCVPDEPYCVGNDVYQCNGEGSGGSMTGTCSSGTICSAGECKTPCEQAADTPSTVGCEFWAVDMDNERFSGGGLSNDAAGAPFAVVLANNNDTAASVRITINTAPYGMPVAETDVETVVVPPKGVRQVNLPQREIDGTMGQNGSYQPGTGSGTFVSSHGFKLQSSLPIVAYQFNPIEQQFSNDASILLPIQALGKEYTVLGWPTANPCGPGPGELGHQDSIPDHTAVTIVGTAPGTVVTITPTHDIQEAGGTTGLTVPRIPAGQPFTFTVGPYDVVNFESYQPQADFLQCISLAGDFNGDFTGSVISASAPVVVFTGAERAIGFADASPAPTPPPEWDQKLCCTDHLEDQLLPTRALGREYAVARSAVRSAPPYQEPDLYRFVGTVGGTVVTTNLPPPLNMFTLNAGESRTFPANTGFAASATEPVMLGQVLVPGSFTTQGAIGDPTLVMIPAAEQFRKEYVFLVPSTFDVDYIVIAKPSDAQVFIDGQPLSSFANCYTGPVGTVATVLYEQVTCPITDGAHTLGSDKPTGLFVYGYFRASSYGFAGGSDLKIINPIE